MSKALHGGKAASQGAGLSIGVGPYFRPRRAMALPYDVSLKGYLPHFRLCAGHVEEERMFHAHALLVGRRTARARQLQGRAPRSRGRTGPHASGISAILGEPKWRLTPCLGQGGGRDASS